MTCLICDNIQQYLILGGAGLLVTAALIAETLTVGRRWAELPRRSAGWITIFAPAFVLALFGYLDFLTVFALFVAGGLGGVIVWFRQGADIDELDKRFAELCEDEE